MSRCPELKIRIEELEAKIARLHELLGDALHEMMFDALDHAGKIELRDRVSKEVGDA